MWLARMTSKPLTVERSRDHATERECRYRSSVAKGVSSLFGCQQVNLLPHAQEALSATARAGKAQRAAAGLHEAGPFDVGVANEI